MALFVICWAALLAAMATTALRVTVTIWAIDTATPAADRRSTWCAGAATVVCAAVSLLYRFTEQDTAALFTLTLAVLNGAAWEASFRSAVRWSRRYGDTVDHRQ